MKTEGLESVATIEGGRKNRRPLFYSHPLDDLARREPPEVADVSIRFQDKTSLDFVIDTCFTLQTDYTDWKTGNMRLIKRCPLIHSQSRRA